MCTIKTNMFLLPSRSMFPTVAHLFCIAGLAALAMGQQATQSPAEFQAIINSVFGTAPTGPTRGFANIVTPEPQPFVQPTTAPQTLKQDTADECTCVAYHRCDPANNMIRPDADADADFDGFGVIDVRIDTRECQAVLDVCCRGQFQREVTIPVAPVVQKPNRAAGCGIRNVGGIDFQLAGANVSEAVGSERVSEFDLMLLCVCVCLQNNEAGFGEFPWTVALIRIADDELVCVGSLIHPKVVLTGNHCVKE